MFGLLCRVVAITAASTLVVPSHAAAAPTQVLTRPDAREHFERGQAAFERGDYAAAIPELKAAYAAEPNPLLLYAWGQAERMAGNCTKAIELYRRFLASDPADDQARLAQTNIIDCEAELGTRGPPPPAPPVGPEDDSPPEPPPPVTAPKPWYRDWVGGTLVGLGGAVAVAGGVSLALGIRQTDAAADAATEGEYFQDVEAGRAKAIAGATLLGVGGVLVVAGAIRWGVLRNRSKQKAIAAGLQLPAGGVGLTLRGRF